MCRQRYLVIVTIILQWCLATAIIIHLTKPLLALITHLRRLYSLRIHLLRVAITKFLHQDHLGPPVYLWMVEKRRCLQYRRWVPSFDFFLSCKLGLCLVEGGKEYFNLYKIKIFFCYRIFLTFLTIHLR